MSNLEPSGAIRKNNIDIAKHVSMLNLSENLVISEEDRLSGGIGYSVDEVAAMMKNAVQEVLDKKTASSNL